ncbi:hypothetical protein PG993_003024 [Apiospora rasikravindrae]|uniref:ABM domain-containing protein n=1 Tax=Apiospora rasikravindrae TaxID=990691 RepID=A0ABR1TYD3_9PEZI
MARTKRTARPSEKPTVTWTRFYLPRGQEMVENPEQAAYIIEWRSLDAFKNFLSSPACAEFLRNLPEYGDSRDSIESGSALMEVTGRVIFTTFSVPYKVDNLTEMYKDVFESNFSTFVPPGSEFMKWRHNQWSRFSAVWFFVLTEDHWVEEKFGKLERQKEGENQARTLFCHAFPWQPSYGGTPEQEAVSAADPLARESWHQHIARVMPPATAWVQERWDIQEIPRFLPPEPEMSPEEAEEWERQKRLTRDFLRANGLEPSERWQ